MISQCQSLNQLNLCQCRLGVDHTEQTNIINHHQPAARLGLWRATTGLHYQISVWHSNKLDSFSSPSHSQQEEKLKIKIITVQSHSRLWRESLNTHNLCLGDNSSRPSSRACGWCTSWLSHSSCRSYLIPITSHMTPVYTPLDNVWSTVGLTGGSHIRLWPYKFRNDKYKISKEEKASLLTPK